MNLLKIVGFFTFAFIAVTSQSPGNCPNGVTSCPSSSPVPSPCFATDCTKPDMSPAPSPYPCTYGNCTRPSMSSVPSPPPSFSSVPSMIPPSSSPVPCDVTAAGQNCNTKPSPPPSMTPQPPRMSPQSSNMPPRSPMESSSPSPSEMPPRSPIESSSPSSSEMPTRSPMPSKPPMESSSPIRSPMLTRSMLPTTPPSQKPSPPPTQSPQKSQEPPVQSQQPSSIPSRSVKPNPPINTQINFRGLNLQQVTNNTLQQIQGSISCSLNTPSSNVILQNVSFTDTTGARYNVPFDASLVNQQTAPCTRSGVRLLKDLNVKSSNSKDVKILNSKSLQSLSVKSLAVRGSNSLQNIRKLQATTILTVNYIIMNPSNDIFNMNETALETLITSSPFIASVGLGAPEQSTVASSSNNNNLITAIAAPLGAIAAIAIIAVVVLMVYNNNRKTQVINKIVYVTETPLSASKDVNVANYDRVDYMPRQIRV